MSEAIKAQYQILADLKKIEEKIHRLEIEAQRIPEELNKLEAAAKSRRDEYEKLKTTFEASEKNLRKLESDLREREDKLHKAEGKMMEVKTNEEYQAAIKENQASKTEKSGLEEQVLTNLNAVEEQRKKIKDLEKDYKTFESSISEDKTRLTEERSKVMALIEEQLGKKKEYTSQLDRDVADLYQRVAARARGGAVVEVENGMCRACNMKIRPQLYNEVIGYKMVHRCPNCGRLLITVPKGAASDPEGIAAK